MQAHSNTPMGFVMTNQEYHAHKAISKSKLDAARKSGRHLYDMLYGPPRESTAAFDLGTVLHASALPGEDPDSIAVRMPSGMKKTTKEGKAFVAEHEGKIILSPSDAFLIDQMMASLLNTRLAKLLSKERASWPIGAKAFFALMMRLVWNSSVDQTSC